MVVRPFLETFLKRRAQASTPRDIILKIVIVLKLRERQRRRISERYKVTIACLRVSHAAVTLL